MCAQMVDMVQHPDCHDFKEIVKSHIYLDMKCGISITSSNYFKAAQNLNSLRRLNRCSTN